MWDLKMLTFIDGEPLKAGLLLQGFTVSQLPLPFKGPAYIVLPNNGSPMKSQFFVPALFRPTSARVISKVLLLVYVIFSSS